jgi:hypothetical protein
MYPNGCQCCTQQGKQCSRPKKIGDFCTQHSHGQCNIRVYKQGGQSPPSTPFLKSGSLGDFVPPRQEVERKARQEVERKARQEVERKVLIIEDNEYTLYSLAHYMNTTYYCQVTTAHTNGIANEYLTNNKYDLIITDTFLVSQGVIKGISKRNDLDEIYVHNGDTPIIFTDKLMTWHIS